MRTRSITHAMMLLAASASLAVSSAETIDRIAVTVGTHVIAESEIVADVRLSAFLDGVAPVITAVTKRKAADRLVDQYLVLQDAALARTLLPTVADVAPLLAPIRARYASDGEYANALVSAGITEAELTAHLLAGLQMLRYTDLRFRPEVQVSEQDLHDYYDKLTAKANPAPPSFEESRNEVERLLTGERMLQTLDRWLGMTRSETAILYRDEALK
jgi:hypothetical protein